MKLSKNELQSIRDAQYALGLAKMRLGEFELKKAELIKNAESASLRCMSEEAKIVDKYGEDISFNLETGEIKKK